MIRFCSLVLLSLVLAFSVSGQALSIDELIKGVKAGQAKQLYQYALKKGMMGYGLAVSNKWDFASDDIDKEWLCGTYRATTEDKNFFKWALTVDSFTVSHRIQASYTVPPKEAENIRKMLIARKFTKNQGNGPETWEKDGVIIEFTSVTDDIYIYLKQ